MNFAWAALLKEKPWVRNNLNVKQWEIATVIDYSAVITNTLEECFVMGESAHNMRHLKMWAIK